MRVVVFASALGAFSLSAFAAQQHQHEQQQEQPQTLQQLKMTVVNTTTAEISAQPSPTPTPGGSGGSAETYCEAATNSQGNVALINYSGSFILQDQSFALSVTGQTLHPASFGMFTYGTAPTNVPFGNGFLCISPFAPGIYRMPTQALSQPTIILAMEDAPGQFSLLTPGSSWYFQFWYRDAAAGHSNFNLSNGLHVTFAPTP